jgi:hypothetical protein
VTPPPDRPMNPENQVRVFVPNAFVPILAGIYAWQIQGWIGAIVTYVAVIGLIALLLGIAERSGWSLKKYLRVRFLLVFGSMVLFGISSAGICDASLTACSSPFF